MFGDVFSSLVSAYSNHREAEQNRDWQELQRKTAYQDTVKDLSAAGLSPMLAYSRGATPSGSGATAAPMKPLELGATEQRQSQSELSRANADLAKEQVEVAKSTKELNYSNALKAQTEAYNVAQQTSTHPVMSAAQIQELKDRAALHGFSSKHLDQLIKEIIQTMDIKKPAQRFANEEPEKAKWLNPLTEALNTVFKGIGALRGNSATINTTTTYPDGSKSTKTTTRK